MKDVEGAILEFSRVIILEPSRYEGYYALAQAYLVKEDFERNPKTDLSITDPQIALVFQNGI